MKKMAMFDIEYMCQFENVFNLLRDNPRVNGLKLNRVIKWDNPEENVYSIEFEFDVEDLEDYAIVKECIMEFSNLEPMNMLFS